MRCRSLKSNAVVPVCWHRYGKPQRGTADQGKSTLGSCENHLLAHSPKRAGSRMQLSFPTSKWRLTCPRPQVCELFGTDRADERREPGRDIDGSNGFLE